MYRCWWADKQIMLTAYFLSTEILFIFINIPEWHALNKVLVYLLRFITNNYVVEYTNALK
jgi:hypothetical protein